MLTAGTLVAHRYVLVRALGEGGEGTTYEALDRALERRVALKVLGDPARDADLRAEFARLMGLAHPGLARVLDLGVHRDEDGARTFVTSELVEGMTLEEAARRGSFRDVRRALGDALSALAFLHSIGLVHGDVTPRNVLVQEGGGGVLIDLGCARAIGRAPSEISGTRGYLAPEALRGEPASVAMDVYAAGALLEAIGRTLRGGLPARVQQIAERATRKATHARPADIAELIEAAGLRATRASSGEARRIVGRGRELAQLEARARETASGTPSARWLAVVGPEGVGRTRLLRELVMRAALSLDVVEVIGPSEGAVRAALARAGVSSATLEDALLGLAARASVGPALLVVLDDADRHVDRDEWRALARARARGDRVLFVESAREAPRGAETIALGALEVAAVSAWAAQVVPEPYVLDVLAASGGVPALISELMRRVASGALAPEEIAGTRMHAASTELPDEPAAREVLAWIALAREPLGEDVLARAGAAPGAIDGLAASGLVRIERGHARMARPDVAEAALGAIDRRTRRALAERLARALLERESDAVARATAIEVWARGGRSDRAREALSEARAALISRPSLLSRALDAILEAALAEAPQDALDHALEAASARTEAGDARGALRAIARALRALSRARARAAMRSPRVVLEVTAAYLRLGRPRRAERWAARFAPASRGRGATLELRGQRARLADLRARAAIAEGRYADARALAEAGREHARDEAAIAALDEDAGVAAIYLGDLAGARAALSRAEETSRRSRSARAELRAASYLGILALRAGDPVAAGEGFARALAIAERERLPDAIVQCALNVATAAHTAGEWGAALGSYERALRLAVALGRTASVATLRYDLARLFFDLGAEERALAAWEETEAAIRAAGSTHLALGLAMLRAEIDLRAERWADARERLLSVHHEASEHGLARERCEAALHLAEAALGAGDADEAARRLEESASEDAADLALSRARIEGELLGVRGASERAIGTLERAIEDAMRAGVRPREAELRITLHRVATRLSAGALAARERERALAVLERMAATLPEPHRASALRAPRLAALRGAPVEARIEPATTAKSAHAELTRLLAINRRLTASLAWDEVLRATLDAAIELLDAERGFLLLREPDGSLGVAIARNVGHAELESRELSRGIAERVVETGEPVLTVDALADARFASHVSIHAMRLRSIVCAPIATPEGVIGALYVDNRFRRGRASEGDVELVMAFADQAAIALRTARLVSALERERTRLAELSEAQASELTALRQEREEGSLRFDYGAMVGRGAAMQKLLATLDRLTPSDVSVLVRGESGSGKELVARALHANGPRKDRPFFAVNCAAIGAELLESELFGHKRGAFTGASSDRAGYFVAANGGTLFLDEIGEMPLAMQAKLLRALEAREVRPVGSDRAIPVDVRVLSATHRDLRAHIETGQFREDLYFRLAVVEVRVPPLRERREDLPELCAHLLARIAERRGEPPRTLSRAALRRLVSHPFPGNVRELANVLEKAVLLSDGREIEASAIELPEAARPARVSSRADVEREEKREIADALARHRWNVSEVVRALGIPRTTLYRKLAKYGLSE